MMVALSFVSFRHVNKIVRVMDGIYLLRILHVLQFVEMDSAEVHNNVMMVIS